MFEAIRRRDQRASRANASLLTSDVDQSIHLRDRVLELLDGSADGFCALDGAGRIIYLNPAAERILGGTRAELIERPVVDLLGEQAPLLRRAIEERGAAGDFRFRAAGAAQAGERWFDVRACSSDDAGAGTGAGAGAV